MLSTRDCALKKFDAMELFEDEPCSIAEALLRTEVSHQHEGHPRLEADLMARETSRTQSVKVLSAVAEGVLLIGQGV